MARGDTSAVGVSESSSVSQQTNFPGNDIASIAIAESSSVQISGTTTVSSTDTSAIAIAEGRQVAQTRLVVTSDSSALSVNEFASSSGTMLSIDAAAISIADTSVITKSISVSDDAVLIASETTDLAALDALLQVVSSDTIAIHVAEHSLVLNPFADVSQIRAGGHIESRRNFASELDNDTIVTEHNVQIRNTGGSTQQQSRVE
jgi:hypothetical protein